MPQICTICRHERQVEIDQALVAGTSLRNIAERFGTSATALHRHKKHLAKHVVAAKAAAQEADADTLLDRVKRLLADAQRITVQAEQAKQLDIALRGIREVRGVLELLSRVSSELTAQAFSESQARVSAATAGAREKLLAKLRQPMTSREAEKRVRALCEEYGLDLVPLAGLKDPKENEKRIQELMVKGGLISTPPN